MSVAERELVIAYRARPLPTWVRAPFEPGALWDMTPAARAFHESRARVRVMRGGVGSTKTHTLARAALFLAVQNLGEVGLVIAPNYPLLRLVFRPAFEEFLEECELSEGADWTYNKNEWTYRLLGGASDGGADIVLRSGGAWPKIVGVNAAWACIDEPAEMPREALARVMYRTRRGQERIAIVGTPDPGSWWAEWLRRPPPDCDVIRARTSDSPFVSEAYMESLRQELDEDTLRAMLDGEIVALAGAAYREFAEEPWPSGNLWGGEYEPELPLVVALDNNREPLCCALMQEHGRRLHQFDEVMILHGSWAELAERIAVKLGQRAPAGMVFAGDAVLRGLVTDERTDWGHYLDVRQQLERVLPGGWRATLGAPKGNPLVVNRVSAMRAMLCNAKGERSYTVHPRCVETITDWREVQADRDGQILKPTNAGRGRKISKLRTHLSDAVSYHAAKTRPRKVRRRGLALVGRGPSD